MSDHTNGKRSKSVVDVYYQAGAQRRLTDFAPYLHAKATSIWVAYFEPQALLDKLGIAHGLRE